jgi:hypothetical protein
MIAPLKSPTSAQPLGLHSMTLDDAWWTGPLLAASAATLSHGHFLFEPYLYDSISNGRFDDQGARHETARAEAFRSQTSSESLGFAPAVEYNWSSNVGVIFGAKLVTAGHNTDAVVIPVVAINVVY